MSDAPKANTPWRISTATLAEVTMSIVRTTVHFVSTDTSVRAERDEQEDLPGDVAEREPPHAG